MFKHLSSRATPGQAGSATARTPQSRGRRAAPATAAGLLTVLLAGLVAGGCASPGGPAPGGPGAGVAAPPACGSPTVVNIHSFTITGAKTATIVVDPDKAGIPLSGGLVRWQLAGNALQFASSGVNFDKTPPQPAPPAGVVLSSGVGSAADKYDICFGRVPPPTTSFAWPYNIVFYDKSSPATIWTCDPTIVNADSLIGVVLTRATVNCSTP